MTTTTTAIQKTNGARSDLKAFLEGPAVAAKLAEVATSALKPQDLVRLALMAASRQPDLKKCSQASILRSLLDAAALGIKPGGLMGRGYLVPRKNKHNNELECAFDPGWRGLVDIARRSGQIRRLEAHVVHARDAFVVERAPLTTVRHVPSEDADPGEVRAAYAVAEFANGEIQIEIVWKRDLDKIRKLGAGAGPWSNWYDEMARKTAVRRLCKYLPYDPLLERAIEASTEAESDDMMARDVEVTSLREPQSQGRRVAARLASRATAEAQAIVDDITGGEVDEQGPADAHAETEPPPAEERQPGED